MSSCWRKPEQHDNELEFDNSEIISPLKNNTHFDLPFIQEYHLYKGQIIPDTIIKGKEAYKIKTIHNLLILNGFCIMTENGNVRYIQLFGIHPNKDPNTGVYCLPDHKINEKFTEDYFNRLVRAIQIYYLDNAYFKPGMKYVTYEKLKSIKISAQ